MQLGKHHRARAGRAGLGFFGLAIATVVVACAANEADEDPAKAAQDSFLANYCENIKTCCINHLQLPDDPAACKKHVAELDPQMVKSELAQKACLDQLRRAISQADFCTAFGTLDLPACPDIRRKGTIGAKKLGEICAADAECAPSFDGPVACKVVCQVTRRGKEGEGPCVATVDGDLVSSINDAAEGPVAFLCHTRDGFYCDENKKSCVKPKAAGDGCEEHEDCAPAGFCDPESSKCKVKLFADSACTEDFQCQGKCSKEKFCTAAVEEGEACSVDTECTTKLCENKKCVKPTPNTRLREACTATAPEPAP